MVYHSIFMEAKAIQIMDDGNRLDFISNDNFFVKCEGFLLSTKD